MSKFKKGDPRRRDKQPTRVRGRDLLEPSVVSTRYPSWKARRTQKERNEHVGGALPNLVEEFLDLEHLFTGASI